MRSILRARGVLAVAALTLTLSFAFALTHDAYSRELSPFIIKELESIPNGIVEARQDVPDGAYGTVYSAAAEVQQDHLEALRQKAYGLSLMPNDHFVDQSRAIYLLEQEVRFFLERIPVSGLTEFEYESLIFNAVDTYQAIRQQASRIYENMLRLVDIALPGPNGPQIREENYDGDTMYEPNYRSDTPLSDREKKAFYKKKLSEFFANGGKASDMYLLSAAKVIGLHGSRFFEYVMTESGRVRVTEGQAGHLILSGDQKVRAAGGIAIIKNSLDQAVMAVVSNASGTYKPDLLAAQATAEIVARLTGLPLSHVVVTRGEAFGLQNVKILLKAKGLPKPEIEEELTKLRELADGTRATSSPVRCETLFKSH